MDALEAIRKRRSVRKYTDRPVSDEDLDEVLRLALLAPTGGMTQAWSILVVRDPERSGRRSPTCSSAAGASTSASPARRRRARRPRSTRSGPAATRARSWPPTRRRRSGSWACACRATPTRPTRDGDWERDADMVSVGFMFENLMVAARAKGLGTVPSVFQLFVEDEFRALLGHPARGRGPARHAARLPRGVPRRPAARPGQDPPSLADPGPRRPLGRPQGLTRGAWPLGRVALGHLATAPGP